ncbi:hypothetical protein ACIQCQ_28960 [Streptomyces sp. NPDC088394]|uniref:hypothetical protein n=1 Tax=Streptomyces sp. NPDC088394 TaxID=3365860 RepID=UPI003808E5BE
MSAHPRVRKASWCGWSSARELKALVDEMITPGYQGRALIELLQNAGCPETYGRKVRSFIPAEGLRVQDVVLRLRMRLIMVHTQIDEATAREAIERADDARVMSKAWSSWRGTAEVSVAVPAGDRPLGRRAAVRVLADGGRGALSGARVRQRTVLHRLRAPPAALVDLLCWSAARVHRLESTMRVLGQQLVKVAFLPALHPAGDHTSLACVFGWQRPEKARLFTPEAPAAAGVEDLVDPGLRPRAAARRGTGVFIPRPMEPSATSTPASTGPSADTAGATAAPVPGRLAAHIRFVHGGMPWFGKRATRRTQGLRRLEQQEFIHAYAPQAVLGAAPVPPEERSVQRPIAVGPTLRGHEDATARHRCTHRGYRGPPAATDRQQRCVDGSYGPLGRLDQASHRHHGTPLRGARRDGEFPWRGRMASRFLPAE